MYSTLEKIKNYNFPRANEITGSSNKSSPKYCIVLRGILIDGLDFKEIRLSCLFFDISRGEKEKEREFSILYRFIHTYFGFCCFPRNAFRADDITVRAPVIILLSAQYRSESRGMS